MHLVELFEPLTESARDPNIFKAVFVAGPPGSGKNFITRALGLESAGFKLVDIDDVLFKMKKKQPDIDYKRAHFISAKRRSLWVQNYLGLAILNTGRRAARIIELNNALTNSGYSTSMIFINVDRELAQRRISAREKNSPHPGDRSRKVDMDYFQEAYDAVMQNKEIFEHLFDTFVDIENNDAISSSIVVAKKALNKFVQQPISTKAKEQIALRT